MTPKISCLPPQFFPVAAFYKNYLWVSQFDEFMTILDILTITFLCNVDDPRSQKAPIACKRHAARIPLTTREIAFHFLLKISQNIATVLSKSPISKNQNPLC